MRNTFMRGAHALAAAGLACLLVLGGCADPATEPDAGREHGDTKPNATQNDASAREQTNEGGVTYEDILVEDTDEEPALAPASLAAGTNVTPADVKRAGGVDAFFWEEPIPDAVFARMEGRSFGADCTVAREDLHYVRVLHNNAEGETLVGELVVNRRVAQEVVDIFRQLYDAHYPIYKMVLVDEYGADDAASCADGNTSAFNYRTIAGTSQISNHAYGLAVDINTFQNPYYVVSTGHVWPPEAARYLDRTLDEPYMIHPGDLCYELFESHGWSWGGDWSDTKDYQHFEKPQALQEP